MSDGMGAGEHELDLVVGSMITTNPDEDRAMYEEEKAWAEDVQDLLREEGIEVDLMTSPGTEAWTGMIQSFSDLYQLRRLAVHVERGNDISNLPVQDDDELDDLLVEVWEGNAETKYPHLINHQGDSGYYLPVDFDDPIWLSYDIEEDEDEWADEEDEDVVSFGSSVALHRELSELEGRLASAGGAAAEGARKALQAFKEGARQSVENKMPLILW